MIYVDDDYDDDYKYDSFSDYNLVNYDLLIE